MNILKLFVSASSSETDEVQKLYESELLFIEACLKVNPKSYGCWHHRTWVNPRLPRPDWKRELGLCDRCLGLDERNCTRSVAERTVCCSDLYVSLVADVCFSRLFSQSTAGITAAPWSKSPGFLSSRSCSLQIA